MVELNNKEQKKRCFIVGTGSSINHQDLTLLENEIVIGVGGLFMHKDINIINPTYYVLPPVFSYHKQYANELEYVNRLFDMEKSLNSDTTYFLSDLDIPYLKKYNLLKNKNIIFQTYVPYTEFDEIKEIRLTQFQNVWSVSESAIQIALYLGFEEIFLLGFDHDWFNGVFVHFNGKEYLKHLTNEKGDIQNMHLFDSELQMRRHAFIFNKYKKLYNLKHNIYNANNNENTYVDVFPKVNYEKLFRKDYKQYLAKIKMNFVSIPSVQKNDNKRITLSKQLNKLTHQINAFESKNKIYVIYGYGIVGKIICNMIHEPLIVFVDQKSNLVSKEIKKGEIYHPESLKNMEYDKIIISVLGREEEIIQYLVEELNIDKHKIITLDIG